MPKGKKTQGRLHRSVCHSHIQTVAINCCHMSVYVTDYNALDVTDYTFL